MSRTRAYSQDTLDIQKRYFDIMQELVDAKKFPEASQGSVRFTGLTAGIGMPSGQTTAEVILRSHGLCR